MHSPKELANLVAVKTELARKYAHRALLAGSKTKQATYGKRSLRYTRQAETLRLTAVKHD